MPTNHSLALAFITLYMECDSKDEFIHVMKNKTELYNGDVDLLWEIISVSYGRGFDDNYDF